MSKGVKLIRWPVEAETRNYCRRAGIPRLLVVEAGNEAPVCVDPTEDWIRASAPRGDVEARIQALAQRAYGQQTPTVDSTGILYFGTDSVAISSTQIGIMEHFVAHYGEVVYRSELEQHVAKATGKISRNALDLQIMRLRRRIVSVGLSIRTVWGRGYILEAATA
ncbi:winged helix-turn-helix domain-containing protein [Streptomyces olivaceoviridis]|uniref:winged helix-turn-helix domain-containing protein n=1 Tax=Streptomyces olivaceoviridis TaxID=1921 RepID=UPI0036AF3E05